MIAVGTSGYSYPAWRGSFYPAKLPARAMLAYYASQFGAVEINATFYKKPTLETVRAWAGQVPDAFRFALKGWQRITHQKRLRGCGALLRQFAPVARALGPKAGPLLWQLPPNFKCDVKLLEKFLAALPADLRHAFEFRHESWFDDAVYDALKAAGAALCIADTDDLQTPAERTAAFGYFRLRRLDYDAAALRRWKRVVTRFPEAYVFFKHEDEARGPVFAKQFLNGR